MARWGSNGIAFVTNSQLYMTGAAGVPYICSREVAFRVCHSYVGWLLIWVRVLIPHG
ncbi:hypothetical protein HDF10_003012 [Edaphobacter lichenicola]|uniref:Uncharacterized protein n=1 Tax=Tunturiibacter lichenicola TaxID=2051959 RepID=A0A7W8J9N2_9BACT|nr:hypothetical protein [Edaphobacter lichenicola]